MDRIVPNDKAAPGPGGLLGRSAAHDCGGVSEAGIVRCDSLDGLDAIWRDEVLAVIAMPPAPSWLPDLAAAVERGKIALPRTQLTGCSRDQFAAWLDRNLPPLPLLDPLRDDLLALVDVFATLTGAGRYIIRLLAAVPNTECGFHVDTVPPGAPSWGLLRVYNGAGTLYPAPDNLTGYDDFYRYLEKRERLVRERAQARESSQTTSAREAERAIRALDGEAAFLLDPRALRSTPPAAVVAFKHLDAGEHWSAQPSRPVWIHCSPMAGLPRLLVNITAAERAFRRPRSSDAIAPGGSGPVA